MRRSIQIFIVLAALAAPATAQAGVPSVGRVTVQDQDPFYAGYGAQTYVTYDGISGGERLTVTSDATSVTFSDPLGVIHSRSPQCSGTVHVLTCTTKYWVEYVTVNTGPGNDHASVTGTDPADLFGGAGDDVLSIGDNGRYLRGGTGSDILTGGAGADIISGDGSYGSPVSQVLGVNPPLDPAPPLDGPDEIDCGADGGPPYRTDTAYAKADDTVVNCESVIPE